MDFDDKPPIEHLQILNDVLASLSSHLKADVQALPRDEIVEEMIQFLLVHKYKLIPSDEYERLDWMEGVRNGRKETIYPILHWVLSDYETLRKRTYLSQYLLPVDVPTDYLLQTNGNLEELLDAYKELQAEVRSFSLFAHCYPQKHMKIICSLLSSVYRSAQAL